MKDTYTIKELSMILRISKYYLYEFIRKGELKSEKVSKKKIVVTKENLMEFLDTKPKLKRVFDNGVISEYILYKIKVLEDFNIHLTKEQSEHMWSLKTEGAVDAYARTLTGAYAFVFQGGQYDG